MLLREPDRASTSAGTWIADVVLAVAVAVVACWGGPDTARVALWLLRRAARRRRDWERARERVGAVSRSDSVSVDAGEGESSSTSRSSSVHVW